MPDNKSNNRRGPVKGGPERFQPKVIIFWVVLIALMLIIWQQSNKTSVVDPLSVSEVVELTKDGRVRGGKISPMQNGGSDWYEIGGTIAVSVTNENGEEVLANKAFAAKGRLSEANYDILQSSGVFTETSPNNFVPQLLAGIIPFLLVIGLLYFLFVRQLRMAGKGALNFGKSKAKLLTRDKDKVTFANVAGCDEAKEEVSEVIDFLKDPKKFQRMGGKIPKGILMVGPPGTGKTLLAKAVAGEADVPFFSISGSDFVEMFVGVGASRVRDMFEQGRKSAPCLIFVDEIDAVGRQRGAGLGGGNDEREQTLNSLLVEMDGFDTTEGVIIIAATNRADVLDKALLRPGRFDRQVVVDLPDLRGREEILKVHAKKIRLSNEVNLSSIARVTPGFAGADLANLLNEGALTAARKGKDQVENIDMDEARDKISYGRERRRVVDEEDLKSTAYHEAGHALVRAVLKDKDVRLHKVTILPRGRAMGMAMFAPTKDVLGSSRNQMLDMIAVGLAGRIAEEIVTGDYSTGAQSDISQSTKIARDMVCRYGMSSLGPIAFGDNQDQVFLGRDINRTQDHSERTAEKIDEAVSELIHEQFERAKTVIEERKEELIVLAEALLKYETIEGKHVDEILTYGEIRSEVVSSKTELDERLEQEKAKLEQKKTAAKAKEDTPPPAVDGAPSIA
ncbi:ATP-dependent zinc metalloprotease FtsH [Pelagicoccus albus]|uniref:ATP-dependent zinc metalloprotease FtsH n=1 Tax=Pelagicoccus albus TaxID=415222 RepID=A0A7X1B4G9_9BACT|nr:ATP-dependent zinc metalloprotease FtsH [Pelagicoccus albus]MBC2605504.1 ATP-dependent zinc metalloprotease FtsH [Pelagicoccus albus]